VLEALAALSEAEREVLMLAAWEELSSSEAARVLGCSATAYRIRLHRARKRLRERLGSRVQPLARAAPTEESASC
jgi:RNA polymerase sigma-70 factor, ECF subfamily